MAYDIFLGQTKEDWSREGRNGGRPTPGRDAAAGAFLLGVGLALAIVKGPENKGTSDLEDGEGGPGDGGPLLPPVRPLSGGPREFRDDYPDERTTMEIPAFEPMSEVVRRRLR
jgi:hypothetical protein